MEDHPDTAEAMADLLRATGRRVTVAGSVAEGRAMAEASAANGNGSRIDLVLSDIGLPDGSGHDLMAELSSRFGLRGIALTGYGMEEDVERSRQVGFARHLTKPVSLEQLEAAIRQGWDLFLRPDDGFVGMSGFGASAPAPALYEHFGITAQTVARLARDLAA